ncbi:MAG: FkbM family methyltransferase [Anaerolineaceae bacterium]|nr:FkbM family methyltransferase [Anaerolineaceae bacterium]
MELDRTLSALTRHIPNYRGVSRLLAPIVSHYATQYQQSANRQLIIDDFDGDLKLNVDRSGGMTQNLYWRGISTYDELKALLPFAKPQSVFLDIGANIGVFSLVMAKHLTEGHIAAFEPAKTNYDVLVKHQMLNNFQHMTTYQFGLSDEDRELTIYSNNPENTSSFNASFYASERFATAIETCQLKTLDGIWPTLDLPRVDLVKIDTEGAELTVLRGGEATLAKYKPVILLELVKAFYKNAGYTAEDLILFLKGIGYDKMSIVKRLGKLAPIAVEDLPETGNLIFEASS